MAIMDKNGNISYVGAVIGSRTHYWLDGMVDEFAIVYDEETEEIKEVQVGYYGSDGYNFYETSFETDLTTENARKIIRAMKAAALVEFEHSVINEKKAIKKGRTAEVIRGRKIPKGTKLVIFWIGERPTYRSRQYAWMNETETIAGGYDEFGNKVWIKAEYLKNITEVKSPSAKERKKFVKSYVDRRDMTSWNIRKIAAGE